MDKVEVDAKALKIVLEALIGSSYSLAKLKMTRGVFDLNNPIDVLIRAYNKAAEEHNAQLRGDS